MAKWVKGQSGNPSGRPVGSTSYKHMVQDAFLNMMQSPTKSNGQTVPYYMAFLDSIKKTALNAGSKEALFMAQLLLKENTIEDLDKIFAKETRENKDFLSYRIYKTCHDYQQKILMTKEKFIFTMAGRRAGKSEGAIKKALTSVVEREEARILFIGLSFTRCLETFWQPIIDGLNELGFEITEQRRTEGIIKTSNNAEIHYCGNTTVDERDKIRGSKWDLVIIDEAQSQKALPVLIDEIIEPTLIDKKGQLMLMGTGPKVRGTYWEELWTNNNKKALKLNWNISNNPFIPDYQKVLEQIKEEKGLTDSSPLFQREYLGQISYDDDALCFRLKDDNYLDETAMKQWIDSQPITDIKFSAGLDYGFSDADGFAIVMFSTSRPERWLIYEYSANRTGITELVNKINEGIKYVNESPLFRQIPDKHFYIYSDAGGAGKKITYELATQYGLPCLDAYKIDKDFQVEMLQEEVRQGYFKCKKDGAFDNEALKTVFARNDRDELTRIIDDDVFHPNLLDAIRYSLSLIWVNYHK